MRTLRQQLFRSHLLVMFVALGVVVAGFAVTIAVLGLVGEVPRLGGDRGRRSGDGGPLALLLSLGAASIAAGLVSWLVAQRLAAPIEAARRATKQIAAGSYGVEVNGGSITELSGLAEDVNRLGAELEATEHRRLELIGDVAHELRNPLATIEASMEALMDGVVPASDETFASVARQAARLRRLAGDLSELSATAEPSVVSELRAVDLGLVLDEVVEHLAVQAGAKGLDLDRSSGAESELLVQGDRDRLVQVFTNIIGNALQYTNQGSVTVIGPTFGSSSTEVDTGLMIEVVVSDTGVGLAADDLGRIFERFHRVDRQSTGTGVGLAVAKSLVEAHGGTVTAASGGLGQGATFTVRLPQLSSPPANGH